MPQLTWLVTGCSSGVGEQFVHAILARGDKVIATARNATERLQGAKDAGAAVLDLDLTLPQEELASKMEHAIGMYGGIDVLVNNAGYIEASLVEEATTHRLLNQFDTNFFGTMAVTRALLPHLRQKKSGIIAFVGSIGGWQGDPGAGPYCATKFALEGIVECLQQEIAPFGIRSVIFEPGYYRTKIMSETNIKAHACEIDDYAPIVKAIEGFVAATNNNQPGDPRKLVERMIDVIKSEGMAAGKPLPKRLPIGRDAMETIKAKCEATLKLCGDWEELITSTDLTPSQ